MPQDLELSYLRAASQVFDRPLLICETNALMIGQYLAGRMMREEPAAPRANRFIGEEQFDREGDQLRWKGYARTGSVARISMIGELVNRGAWMGASSGLTSYEGFAEQLDRAAADDEVHSIVLDVNTPGGEAGGMIETARKVREIAQRKPVHAVVNSLAASAGYGLVSGASEIIATESASLGSIGVVFVHFDRSKYLEERGVRATVLHAGARKVDGHPFAPLEGDALANLQGRIDYLMDQFVGLVSDHRGLSGEAVRAMEANVFPAPVAVEMGLADRIGTMAGLVADLNSAGQGRIITGKRIADMPNSDQKPDAREGMISEAEHAAQLTNARAEGATAERSRIAAILDSEEAGPRASLSRHLALHTDMAPDQARAVLAASPEEMSAAQQGAGQQEGTQQGESFSERKERAASESAPNLSAPAPADQPSEQRKGLSAAVGRFC
uniref:S49 family peptidase n=1 Tax=Stappia sp. TaxID=1870903 RepID=UPI003BAB7203